MYLVVWFQGTALVLQASTHGTRAGTSIVSEMSCIRCVTKHKYAHRLKEHINLCARRLKERADAQKAVNEGGEGQVSARVLVGYVCTGVWVLMPRGL